MQWLSPIVKTFFHAVLGVTPALIAVIGCSVAMFTEPSDYALGYVIGVPLGVAWWRLSYKVHKK